MTLDASRFDLTGPLPTGVTVLEASAGTGKTYTIAALAARFIAEGAVTLDQLLLVTFTRVATSELRERVRERLVLTEAQLARVARGRASRRTWTRSSTSWPRAPLDAVRERQQRLADAIANFDAATIETTHGFCQKVLDELGTLADTDPTSRFVDNVDDLAREVIDDLYVRRFYRNRDGSPSRASRPSRSPGSRSTTRCAPIYPLAPPTGQRRGDAPPARGCRRATSSSGASARSR